MIPPFAVSFSSSLRTRTRSCRGVTFIVISQPPFHSSSNPRSRTVDREFQIRGEMPSNWLAEVLPGRQPPFSPALPSFAERRRFPASLSRQWLHRLGCSVVSKTGQVESYRKEESGKEPLSPGSLPRKRLLPACCCKTRLLKSLSG